MDKKGQGDIKNLKTNPAEEKDDSWGSSSDSDGAIERIVAEKWKQLYGGSKTPTPEPGPDESIAPAQSLPTNGPISSTNKPTTVGPVAAALENQTTLPSRETLDVLEGKNPATELPKVLQFMEFEENEKRNTVKDKQRDREDEDISWSDSELEDKGKKSGIRATVNHQNESKNAVIAHSTVPAPEVLNEGRFGTFEAEITREPEPKFNNDNDKIDSPVSPESGFRIRTNSRIQTEDKLLPMNANDSKSKGSNIATGTTAVPILHDTNLHQLSPSSSWSSSSHLDDHNPGISSRKNSKSNLNDQIQEIPKSIVTNQKNSWATSYTDRLPEKINDLKGLKGSGPVVLDSQEALLDWSSDEDISENVKSPIVTLTQVVSADDLKVNAVTSSETLDNFILSNSTNTTQGNYVIDDSDTYSRSIIKAEVETLFGPKKPLPITIMESSSSLNVNQEESSITDPAEQMPNVNMKVSNYTKPQAVVTAQPNLKGGRKNTDPIPYSKLLMGDPIQRQNHLTGTKRELKAQNVDSFTTISDSKSMGDLSNLSTTRKPLLSRLKGKWSKLTRSASSKSSLSTIPIEPAVTVNSQLPSTEDLIEKKTGPADPNFDTLLDSLAKTEEHALKLLLAAKGILEKKLNDGGDNLDALLANAVKSPRSDAEESSGHDTPLVTYRRGRGEDTGSVGPMPLSKYCDAIDPCNPDPKVVTALIDDMSFLCHKLVGDNRNYKTECLQYASDLQLLREELQCCEKTKNESVSLLAAQELKLKKTQIQLDEVTQERMNLEDVTSTIRQQLNRSDDNLNIEMQKKIRMQETIVQLEAQLQNCSETIQTLEFEKQELLRNCQLHQEDIRQKEEDCCGLREALKKCCSEVDCLQQENKDLKCEKDRFELEMESEKAKGCTVKTFLEESVEALKGQLECLTIEKNEIVRKNNEIMELHLAELECLQEEAETLRQSEKYEKKAREEEEKRLKDCEEQKFRLLKINEDEKIAREDLEKRLRDCQKEIDRRIQLVELPTQTKDQSQISGLLSDCESFQLTVHSLEQEQASLKNEKLSLEQKVMAVETEKLQLQIQLRELQASSEDAKVEKVTFSSDERKQLQTKSHMTMTDLSDIENSNQQLHTQLQNAKTETTAFKNENDRLKEELQRTTAEKNAFEKQNVQLLKKLQITEAVKLQSENEKQKLEERLHLSESIKATLEDERKQLLVEFEKKEATSQQIFINSNQRNQAKLEALPIKAIVSEQFVDRNEVDELKADYEFKLEQLQSRCKLEAEAHCRQKLDEVQNRLEKQYKRRPVPEDPNVNTMISELTATNKSLKQDTKKLKKSLRDRDEHITALQEAINEIKKKYSEQHKELRIQKIKMQGLQTDLERQEAQSLNEREELARESIRISRERKNVEEEKLKLLQEIRITEKDKITLQNLAKMKERIESEVGRLKKVISQQLIDRSELEKVHGEYDTKLREVKNRFDTQIEMNRQLTEINEYLEKQTNDRALIDRIRDSNENVLRKELNSVSISLKLDSEKMKKIIMERDEEIRSLRKAVGFLKTKYATEAQNREELMKKVQILSTISQESLVGCRLESK